MGLTFSRVWERMVSGNKGGQQTKWNFSRGSGRMETTMLDRGFATVRSREFVHVGPVLILREHWSFSWF